MSQSDYPLPFQLTLAVANEISVAVDNQLAFFVQKREFNFAKNVGGAASLSVLATTSTAVGAQAMVHALSQQHTFTMSIQGQTQGARFFNFSLIMGSVNLTEVVEAVENVTSASSLSEIYLVGGATPGDNVHVPCILGKICADVVPQADKSTSFTFLLGVKIPLLFRFPVPFVISIANLGVALSGNDFVTLGHFIIPSFAYDSKVEDYTSRGLIMTINIENGDNLKRCLDTYNTLNILSVYMHGARYSILGKIWTVADAIWIKIGDGSSSSSTGGGGSSSTPDWYYPLKATNTWTLPKSTSSSASFFINFEQNFNLSFSMEFVAPALSVIYKRDNLPAATVATARLLTKTEATASLVIPNKNVRLPFLVELSMVPDSKNNHQSMHLSISLFISPSIYLYICMCV